MKEQLDILRVQMSNALYDEKLEEVRCTRRSNIVQKLISKNNQSSELHVQSTL